MAGNNQLLGWVLIVLGALLLLGWLRIPLLTEIVAVVLIIVGVLILVKSMTGPTWLAILFLVLGVIVLLKGLPFLDDLSRTLSGLINTVVAVVCILVGVLKVMGRM